MALTNTDKKEIEILIRNEIKNFLNVNTSKQFETKLMDTISLSLLFSMIRCPTPTRIISIVVSSMN
jgi:hypothetical protein